MPPATSAVQLPDWLADIRRLSHDSTPNAVVPTSELEEWRYSRIDEIDTTAFSANERPTNAEDQPDRINFADGWLIGELPTIDGATISLASSRDDLSLLDRTKDTIDCLHGSSLASPLLIEAGRGQLISEPIRINHTFETAGGLSAPHLLIRAERSSVITVIEHFRSSDDAQLVLPVVEIKTEPDAVVNHVAVQELGPNTISIARIRGSAGQQSTVTTSVVGLGGSYARTELDVSLDGRGASAKLLSTYLASSTQMLDFRTNQRHSAPDTVSDLVFKGVLAGSASSVYSGMIHVDEDAPGTDASQTNRNVKLSKDAWAYSVPNLEIEQNQVSCSHASTVGEMDEDQLFYLESRGVPDKEAERLLLEGFFAEVTDQIPDAQTRDKVSTSIKAALRQELDQEGA